MSIEKPVNERLKLYERFRESLAKGSDSDADFFDADDLLIIIDQAVDLDDEYTEIEAIMRGYRFFPDNEELRARRAFLYFDLNLDQGVDNIQATLSPDSPMTKILAIRRRESEIDEAEVKKLLDSIIEGADKFDDETIIQLVDCASACNCYDWLKANEKQLRKTTDYLPTLLYELFIVADMQHDRDYCIKLLEELTEIEPFNVDFWNALAQTLVNVADEPNSNEPDFEGALATLEYALAIEHDNPAALTLKASVLLELNRPEEALETIAPLTDNIPSDTAAQIYMRALYMANRPTDSEISRLCRQFPDSEALIHIAMALHAPDIEELLDLHFENVCNDEAGTERWTTRLREYYGQGDLVPALLMLRALKRHNLLDYHLSKLYFTCLYCLELHDDCIAEFDACMAEQPDMLNPTIIVAGMMSYLKKGLKRPAKQALKKLRACFPLHIRDQWVLASTLESIGMSHFITAVSAILDAPGPIDAEELDIFKFPNTFSTEE